MQFEENPDLILDATKNYLIYFLLQNNDVVYVGQTTQNVLRPFAHKDKIFNSVAIIYQTEDKDELDKLEEFYIKKYTPKYNKVFNQDGYANEVVNDLFQLEKIRNFSRYYFTREEINKMLRKDGLCELSKKEYKKLPYLGFNTFEKLTLMDPLSYMKLMKLRIQPIQLTKKSKINFSDTVNEILISMGAR